MFEYVCACMRVCLYVCGCMLVFVCARMFVCALVYVCLCMYVYIYMCVCMYVCVCVCGRLGTKTKTLYRNPKVTFSRSQENNCQMYLRMLCSAT